MKNLKFGFSGNSNVLKKFSTKLGQWWYIFSAASGSAIVSIAASFAGSYKFIEKWDSVSGIPDSTSLLIINPWSAMFLGAIAIIYGGRGTYIDMDNLNSRNKDLTADNAKVGELKEKINSISEDSESLQNQLYDLHVKLVTTWLKGSSRQLKLSSNERATIYYHIDNNFYVLARHSQNPRLAAIHRQKFSVNHGIISKAWEHKVCIDTDNCPQYSDSPDEYKKYMEDNYGYTAKKIDSLNMKSCQYVAISIVDADNHIGVIIFESEDPNKFKTQKIAQITKYCTDYQSYMVDFIRGGIKYDKSARIASASTSKVDEEFLSEFNSGGKS